MKRLFRIFLLPLVLLITLCPRALAEIDERKVQIAGEDFFNTTAQQMMDGTFSLNPIELLNKGVEKFTQEMHDSADLMITLIVFGALSGVIMVLKSSLKNARAAECAVFACFVVMMVAAVRAFSLAMSYASNVIGAMSDFITKLSPIFIALLATSGAITSAAAFHPILSGATYAVTLVMDKCIFPLVQFGAVLSIVNNLSGRVQISGFNALVHSATKWVLTAMLTVFAGITALYGFTAPALDGVGAKAVKFAVGSLVPVVGGLLTDAVETVVGGTLVMKNAVGTAGMLSVCGICAVPVMKIAVIMFLFRFTAAVLEPMADDRVFGLVRDLSGAVTTILAIVITIAVLFMICVSIILAATNLSAV
jgi:stage III sporulation protein AE